MTKKRGNYKLSVITEQTHDQIAMVIDQLTNENGYPPSVRDIAKDMGFSSRNTQHHLDSMERRGLIKRKPGLARTVQIVD